MIVDNEINLAVLECLEGIKVACIKPQCIFSCLSEIDIFCFLNEYHHFRPCPELYLHF